MTSSCVLVFALFGTLGSFAPDSRDVPTTIQSLTTEFPDARVYAHGPDVRAIYGTGMTTAETPERAAAWWVEEHADALGVESIDLRLVRSNVINPAGKFTIFVYQQYVEGIPVESGRVRVLVRNGVPNTVVFVGARLAHLPADGYAADLIEGAAAVASVQGIQQHGHLNDWTAAQLVVFYGATLGERRSSIRAWKFAGTHPVRSEYERYTFFVNAANGRLAHVRSEIYHVDVEGSVTGVATPGLSPDRPDNPPVEAGMESVLVAIQGGAQSFTTEGGYFVIPHDGDTEVTVDAGVAMGRWVDVRNEAGTEILDSLVVTPPGPADFLLNEDADELTTAQINAHIHVTLVHDFYKDRQPAFPNLDVAIPAFVNISASCGAYYSAETINFLRAGFGCPNTAYSTVVAHEYGHFVVDMHDLDQGAFGEGFGDALGNMLYGSPLVAEGFFGPGSFIRNSEDVVEYPCADDVFHCGQTLAGIWWQSKLNFEELLGEQEGLATTQQLFTDWMEITSGGTGDDSADPGTAIEVLTVDDDDSEIGNGTPHYDQICAAFASRNIYCPELTHCEGDVNGDQVVDPLDSGFVLARFGCDVGGGDPNCDEADLNGDGLVDPLDVGFVLARFGVCD